MISGAYSRAGTHEGTQCDLNRQLQDTAWDTRHPPMEFVGRRHHPTLAMHSGTSLSRFPARMALGYAHQPKRLAFGFATSTQSICTKIEAVDDFRYSFASPAMGGERSSTTRRRLAGKICCCCSCSLPAQHSSGEKYCTRCESERAPRRRVLMNYMLRDGWRCSFLEEDLKTTLPRKLTFRDPNNIIELAERCDAFKNLEERQALDHGIEIGRGGIWLDLTAEQYAKLKKC